MLGRAGLLLGRCAVLCFRGLLLRRWAVLYFRDLLVGSESAKNTFNLLENLLHWARVQREQIEFQPQEVDLNQIVGASPQRDINNPIASIDFFGW